MNLSALDGTTQELAVKMEIPLQNPGHAENMGNVARQAIQHRIGREQVARQARVFYQELQ